MDEFRTRVFLIFDNLRNIENEVTIESGSRASKDIVRKRVTTLNRKYATILADR